VEVLPAALARVLAHQCSRVTAHMEMLGLPVSSVARPWLSRLFNGVLPFTLAVRVLDLWLAGGAFFLLPFTTAVFVHLEGALTQLHTADAAEEFLSSTLRECTDLEDILRVANAMNITEREIKKVVDACRADAAPSLEPRKVNDLVFSVPDATALSVTPALAEVLWSWLPDRFRQSAPSLLFSTTTDGFNLTTLYTKAGTISPLLLLISTEAHDLFGAFIASSLCTSEPHFYGTGETFVFRLSPAPARAYRWRPGLPALFLMCQKRSLSVGGGDGVAIYLDADFSCCRCERCTTFDNPPLHKSTNEFESSRVELFALHTP